MARQFSYRHSASDVEIPRHNLLDGRDVHLPLDSLQLLQHGQHMRQNDVSQQDIDGFWHLEWSVPGVMTAHTFDQSWFGVFGFLFLLLLFFLLLFITTTFFIFFLVFLFNTVSIESIGMENWMDYLHRHLRPWLLLPLCRLGPLRL
jgi:hypothetical protein